MVDILSLLYKKHNDWVGIVKSFGCNPETAEDIVMEMYIKIKKKVDEGTDVMYNDNEVNYYYIFKTLNSMFLDLKKKESKVSMISIDEVQIDTTQKINFEEYYSVVQEELKCIHWYDKMVYDLIESGYTIAQLSRETKIQDHRLRHTYKKIKKRIKKKLGL